MDRTNKFQKLADGWANYGAWLLMAVFMASICWLTFRQYATFHTRSADVAFFDQAIWNTLRGRFLYSTVKSRSILSRHFSPYMALLSPLFLIWSDGRILYVVQAAGITLAGYFVFKIVRNKHPQIAPWFLLAFYLNPALHEVALHELRRVTLAIPYLALAMYAISVKKRWLMALGLFFALLCKENIALVVLMVGVYLLLFERDWKWGLSLMVIGGTWLFASMLWIIPAFQPPGEVKDYDLIGYFGGWGDSLGSVLGNMLRNPLALLRQLFDRPALLALWRVFLPLGILLPLLAPDWLLITLPSFAYMLASNQTHMHRLEDWYMASILPVLFATLAVGLNRRSAKWARWSMAGLLCATLIGFGLFSLAPLGGKYDPAFFTLTEHHDLAAQVVAAVPADAGVAAQDALITHLAQREHIYVYPWIPQQEKENIDYYVLDRKLNAYPFSEQEIDWEIDNLVADPSLVVEMEGDGLYLLRVGGPALPSFPVDHVAEGAIRLDRVELAVQDDRGFYSPAPQEPVALYPGQSVRVTLYWEALAPPDGVRTVSVRISDASGALVAQHDMQPSKGARPTTWWEAGWQFRDIYYLELSPQAPAGPGSVDLLLYDSYSSEWVSFEDGTEILPLCSVTILPQ